MWRLHFIRGGISITACLLLIWLGATYYAKRLVIDSTQVGRFSSADPATAKPANKGSLSQAQDPKERILEITCRFRLPEPPRNAGSPPLYLNLFQTAEANTGIRLEFTIPARDQGVASWGLVIANRLEGLVILSLTAFPSYGQWHNLRIYVQGDQAVVWLDGAKVGEGVWPGIDYGLDNIVVGSAVGLSRTFFGDIIDFTIQTRRHSIASTISLIVLNLIPVVLVGCILLDIFVIVWTPGAGWLRPHLVYMPASPRAGWGKLRLLLAIVAFGHLVAGVYYFWNAVYQGRGYPYNSYLCYPVARFSDYDNMILMCRNLNPYHDHSRSGYPPFANLLYYFFSPYSMQFGYLLFLIPPVSFLVWSGRRLLVGYSALQQLLTIVFILLFSYPLLFTIDRGNLELYIMIALGFFFQFYNSTDGWRRELSCLGLAVGISFKIYPVLLLLLPLKDRRYVDCVKVLLISEVLTIIAAMTFVGGPQMAIHDFLNMLSTTDQLVKNQLQYAHGNAGIYYGVVLILTKFELDTLLRWFQQCYWIIAFALMGGYSIQILRARMSYWATSICVVALMCLLPSLSNDYRTVQFLIPLLIFATAHTIESRGHTLIIVLLGVLLIPRNYWILLPEVGPGDVGIGGIITPLVIFALLNVVLFVESAHFKGRDRRLA